MITLQVKRPIQLPIDKSYLQHAAEATLRLWATETKSDVSIVIGNDAFIKTLNLQYRAVNESTDVLSFPSGEIDPDTSDLYLGDVIISLPKAQEQARNAGHPLEEELQLLVVHGILHLLGYDHVRTADKREMQTAQDKILKSLGVNLKIRL